ncbi:MAG TPA: replication-associated recombination protein A [Pseudonocardia sp.]|nr:replication-associated recombination protein A [Pseudonocardia sp.]
MSASGSGFGAEPSPTAPLAVRMRPSVLSEVIGQGHLLSEGAPLRRLVEGAAPASVLLYGPPGTGKTTIARLMAGHGSRHFVALSALSSGVKELRAVIEEARRRLDRGGKTTVLFIDEVHRFSKTQQDALLGAVEDRLVLLVGATTENPSFSVVTPLLSRSLVLKLESLSDADIGAVLDRAVVDPRGLAGRFELVDEARAQLVRLAAGDARRALTVLEAAADAAAALAPDGAGPVIDGEIVRTVVEEASVRYDRAGDQHYDVISAFIKSIRGSDVDAALHYLARMMVAGEDPRFIARRLMVHASEDIGMADPTALPVAVAAAQTVALIGMPEARLALAQATVHLATAPKSNAVIAAVDAAMADVRAGAVGAVPPHLRDGHYTGAARLGNAIGYRYPHDVPDGVLTQQYPPDELVGRDYYQPAGRGAERALAERVPKLRRVIRGE